MAHWSIHIWRDSDGDAPSTSEYANRANDDMTKRQAQERARRISRLPGIQAVDITKWSGHLWEMNGNWEKTFDQLGSQIYRKGYLSENAGDTA